MPRPKLKVDASKPVECQPEAKAEPVRTMETEPWMPPDHRPWIAVAQRVLKGEFNGADGSTREGITIGLRSIQHPTRRKAHAMLER